MAVHVFSFPKGWAEILDVERSDVYRTETYWKTLFAIEISSF